jgi:hypothetical protein
VSVYWMVRSEDDHGQFWMMEEAHRWSDSIDQGKRYATEEEAHRAAEQARASAALSEDWYPRIKVVKFGGRGG